MANQVVTAPVPPTSSLPEGAQAYVLTGVQQSTIPRDLVTVSNQIPRWIWFLAFGGSGYMSYKAYKTYKATRQAAK